MQWAAAQPWSTGKVGMYGKSYDAVTGLIGEDLQPKGLAAVVAQEPVYDLYRYLYMNRVRFENSVATPALYDAIAGEPGSTGDTLAYNSNSVNDTARPGCPVFNHADQQDPNHDAAYWKPRNLITGAKNGHTPLFMTQGFIENNTKPDGAWDYFNDVPGPSAPGSACGTTCAATTATRRWATGWRWAGPAGSPRSCASSTTTWPASP